MVRRIAGKIAVVTAAGNGIGRATAKMFACEGAKVVATDIDDAALSEIPDVPPAGLMSPIRKRFSGSLLK